VTPSGTVDKLLAFAVDCNGRMCELDPFVGAAMAVAEVCRNLVCSGAEPVGITDCLNFGNPERPEVMDSFARAIDGLAAACNALDVPIVSGNVSLYNETAGRAETAGPETSRAILPTPTVAAVGLIAALEHVVTADFKQADHAIVLLGDGGGGGARALGGSEWLVRRLGRLAGQVPLFDLGGEARLQRLVLELARRGLLRSAHDIADGGLAVALAESCTVGAHPIGARVRLAPSISTLDGAAALFGESPSRVVLSARAGDVGAVLDAARIGGVPAAHIGSVGGASLEIEGWVSVSLAAIEASRASCLREIVGAG
jgi:phosphoribosylformylglycinamidine synthase